jgi:hypothetical protein
MVRVGIKYKKIIELCNEKTCEVLRVIRFRNPIAFNDFLKDFDAMRYPGYGWKYIDKGKKRENITNLLLHVEEKIKYQVNRGKKCSISECNNNSKVKGLCISCYQKRKKEVIC